MSVQEIYESWINFLGDEDPLKQELLTIRDKEEEIVDRFYQDIEFGTAGLRGKCGAGTNRMNRFTVGRATQGLANYLLEVGGDPMRGVVIAYDCRYFSKEFSELAAQIFLANGFKVYLFPSLRPTPELSFAIRKLKALSGINLTASHNPKQYNGYKVYWQDGAQISGDISDGIATRIRELNPLTIFSMTDLEKAKKTGMLVELGDEMDRTYGEYVKSLSVKNESEIDNTIPFVYTPLNGAGSIPLKVLFTECGFVGFHMVKEQELPDPEFTTVGYPNPEDPKVFALAEQLGKKINAELLIATDPDSDRMAIEIQEEDGSYRFLNGNQTGAMLIAYLASGKKNTGVLSDRYAMVQSIVTGDMGSMIAESYGIKVYKALTGFKNICGRIPQIKKEGFHYFFGYEESIGYAVGEEVRDKDGISAAMLVVEMAAWCRKKGKHVRDYLEELYQKYGYFQESQYAIVLYGKSGKECIDRIMQHFREENPRVFGEYLVSDQIDYLQGYEDLPKSNVLRFTLDQGSWFAMRPSGTEPKLKFYFYTKQESADKAENVIHQLKENVIGYVQNLCK